MTKLIEAFRKEPSARNAMRIEAQARKHPMAVCMIEPGVLAYLRAIGVRI